jgi:RNA polymerase sigma-70 factor (ECF subfamily)
MPDRRLAEIEELYRTRHAHFVRVARAITTDAERAHEAVQDGFADAIRGRGAFRGDAPLEAWVWRAVVNAARKATRRPLVERTTWTERSAETAISELAPTIAALPERQRLVVFLRYYADLDYRSIAEILGIEVGTVGATLSAAHRAVAHALQEVAADG